MSAARLVAASAGLLAHAAAAGALLEGPAAGAALPGAIALGLALAGGAAGRVLGTWTLRDAYREWALSRNAALGTMAILGGVATLAHFLAGLALALPMLVGFLSVRDAPRASDVAFLGIALEVIGAIAFHAQEWQESVLFALPTVLLVVAFAAREAWDLAAMAAPDEGSRAAARAAYARFLGLLIAGALVAVAIGGWLHAGGRAEWAPGEGARGILLALVIAGSAGAAWVLARRKRAASG